MNNVTLISYPSHRDDSLLCLTDIRSRYMMPFASRFRVADFVLRNAAAVAAKKTFIFSNTFDDLQYYVQKHPYYKNDETSQTQIVLETAHTLAQSAKLILTNPTQYYIIYSGDSPCIVDFEPLLWKFKSKKGGAVLYMLNFDGRPSMARTALLCDKKTLSGVIQKALKEKVQSPNIFEMIINRMILKGIKREKVDAYCAPLQTVPDYYNATFDAFLNRGIWDKIFGDPFMKSGIQVARYARIGQSADIARSYIS
ncbi:MAG: hypothetical protein ACRCUT_01115, partial [Spirochaetota bacterium]